MTGLIVAILFFTTNRTLVYADGITENQRYLYYKSLYSNESDINQKVTNILGVLNQDVTLDERNTICKMMDLIEYDKAEQRLRNTFSKSEEEDRVIQRMCAYLDGLTLKYINGAKQELQYWNAYSENYELPKNNPVIKNLKKTLSINDYKRIIKLYNWYREDNSDVLLNKIYETLEHYNQLDVDAVYYNIFHTNMMTLGQFKMNHKDSSIQYMDPKRYGLSDLSKKEIKKYKMIWSSVKQILPADCFREFLEFDIASDGIYNIMAYVAQMDDSGKTWKLCIDPADVDNKLELARTVVHEYAHYLSLNNEQVTYFAADKNLVPSFYNYTDYELVAKEDSYLNQFYQAFWADIEDDREADEGNALFYVRHYNEFVSEYAATRCVEDFAETFSYYVLGKEDATEQQKKKMKFFDQFETLKQVKQEILENMEACQFDAIKS